MDIVSTKMANTAATNVTKNYYCKKVWCKLDCYIFHTVLTAITFLFIITIICYYYAKHRSKEKGNDAVTI